MASVACIANIDILTENDNALINRANDLGQEIKDRILAEVEPTRIIGEVRGRGLMIGIEMVEDKKTRTPLSVDSVVGIVGAMRNHGILLVPTGRYGNVFRFMPPLTLTREYASKATDIFLDVCRKI